ncbi:hypothetical protein H4R20_001288 [Coemansia guatemalensis]|uniref:Uncharacterized protein n=1 Tax=Coemansia guatemalensis TaxID=2761395 RepID=A0A9W8LVT0_9FUNG|nr:hypothetical protein H4R20_001288 [Coemansia guatemalensis]
MGILKRIKGSYMFTQLEVGKYTKRRTSNQQSNNSPNEMVVRPVTTGFVSEFDRAADELRAEQMAEQQQKQQRRRQKQLQQSAGMDTSSYSSETLANDRQMGRVRSSMDLTATQRERLGGRTAVSTPQSPESNGGFESVRPRPRPRPTARSARSNADMQSVYFAPGRNVTTTNQRHQRMSMYPSESSPSLIPPPAFDKNSASSTDYYVFTPSSNELSGVALENRRKHMRGIVAPEKRTAPEVHRHEARMEAEQVSTNPFVERRRRASPTTPAAVEQEWTTQPLSSAFLPDAAGYNGGGIDPNHPRKHLNSPVYANQAGSNGLDLLA